MKKMTLSLLCAVMAFSLFAAEPEKDNVDFEKRIAELQAQRKTLQDELIKTRKNVIRKDKYAAKLAKELLIINRQLSEYLDAKAEIKGLNSNLSKIDRQLRSLKQQKAELDEKAKKKDDK